MELHPEDYNYTELIRCSKGKSAKYAKEDVVLEVKVNPKATDEARKIVKKIEIRPAESFKISNDIWYHVARHVPPENIQTFALICSETTSLVNTSWFWLNLYKRYCVKSNTRIWQLELPSHLQLDYIREYKEIKILRAHVIEALFYCYQPFKNRLEHGYTIDWLLNRTYISSWQKLTDCIWIVCYKFYNQMLAEASFEEGNKSRDVVNDWELLADDKKFYRTSNGSTNEGLSILVIYCNSYTPLPMELSYESHGSRFRLKAAREMLCKDLRTTNLELDFTSNSSNVMTTVKYTQINRYKVLPWWHPKFETFIK